MQLLNVSLLPYITQSDLTLITEIDDKLTVNISDELPN